MSKLEWNEEKLSKLDRSFLHDVYENMRHDASTVRFGSSGEGKIPNYEIELPCGERVPFRGSSHEKYTHINFFKDDNLSAPFFRWQIERAWVKSALEKMHETEASPENPSLSMIRKHVVGAQDERPYKNFFDRALSTIIDEGQHIPKFQVERAISPLIDVFLEDVLSALREGSEIEVVCAEFPLIKSNAEDPENKSYQSTNVDWLAYDRSSGTLLFVELKTSLPGLRSEQHQKYVNMAEKEASWEELNKDIDCIYKRSSAKKKYEYLKKKIETSSLEEENYPVEIIYLAPNGFNKCKADLEGKVESFLFGEILDRLRTSTRTRENPLLLDIFERLAKI